MIKAMKYNHITLIIVLLMFCMVITAFAISGNTMLFTEGEVEYIESSSIKIAHLTDMHYYPLRYCYNDSDSEFYIDMKANTKILMESSSVFKANLANIRAAAPDYLVITGDMTNDGERASHIDVANALRKLQNDIRADGNADFQVLTIIGNHDIYNHMCSSYGVDGSKQPVANVSRKDISIIYSSLGYPDITQAEADAFYSMDERYFIDELLVTLPYEVADGESVFINSTTSDKLDIIWQYIENGNAGLNDYGHGELTYIASDNAIGLTIIGIDEEDSNEADSHVLSASINGATMQFMENNKPADNHTIIGFLHHNTVSQFSSHHTLLNGFIVSDWVFKADFLADYGMRYTFTGHKHVNSIAHHISFNNNPLTDIETAASCSYKGGFRSLTLSRGTYGDNIAEKMTTEYNLVNNIDFSYLIDNNYITADYLNHNNLNQFMNGKICVNFSEYAKHHIYENVIDNYMIKFLSPQIFEELSVMVSDFLPEKVAFISLSSIKGLIGIIINTVIEEVELKVLDDYVYGGTNPLYMNGQNKLLGYTEELVNRFRSIEVADDGTSIVELLLNSYYLNIAGNAYASYEELPDYIKQGVASLQSGEVVEDILNLLLHEEYGIYRLIKGVLTEELDLTKGLTANEMSSLRFIIRSIVGDNSYDITKVKVEDLILGVFTLMDFDAIDLGDDTVLEFMDHTIDSYITKSLKTGLGDIASNIILNFAIDESPNGDFNGPMLITMNAGDNFTYINIPIEDNPTIENGKLPSMLTVSFGEDTTTDKNIVWLTDRRVTDSKLIISTNADLSNGAQYTGTFDIYAHTTPQIDIGLFATMGISEIGRHSVELRDLTPNTKYYYKVGSSEFDYWSPIYTLKTAPADNSAFEVLIFADPQGYTERSYTEIFKVLNNIDSAFKNGYDFAISVGDNVDNSKNMDHYKYLLNTDQSFWGNTTFVNAVGNHEASSFEVKDGYVPSSSSVITAPYNNNSLYFNVGIPEQNSLTGVYYSFDYSGVHFIVLNTNDIVNNKLSDTQVAWLTNDLASSDKAHKVVIMHKSLYSAGSHSYDSDVIAMRAQLTPIFSDNGVSLVLGGHDHTYSLTYYLDREGKPIKTNANGKSKIGDEGTLYITLGTIGNKFYNWKDNEDVPVFYGKDLHNPYMANPMFAKLIYDGEDLYYEAYEYDMLTGEISELKPKSFDWGLFSIVSIASVITIGGVVILVVHLKKKSLLVA